MTPAPDEIYLDNGATTRPLPEVVEVMRPLLGERFGNPSSLHRRGAQAARVLQRARQTFAEALDARPDDVLFTSGGTEANALGLMGGARARKGGRVLISAIEHPSIAESARLLEREGYRVEVLSVDRHGRVDPVQVEQLVDSDTCALAVMHANNEIGTLQPIAEIAAAAHARNPRCHVHVDCAQSFAKEPVGLSTLGADSLACSSHKIHGPQGVGALVLRQNTPLVPLLGGGGQQRGLRPGTENLSGIAGFAEAARLALLDRPAHHTHMRELRDQLIEGLSSVDGVSLNGHPTQRLCNNVHLSVERVNSEHLLHSLEAQGVLASAGSACHEHEHTLSATLAAIQAGKPHRGFLRLTLSRFSTRDEIERVIDLFAGIVADLRIMDL